MRWSGRRVKQLRERTCLTQKEAAAAVGCSPSKIRDMEADSPKVPSADTVVAMAALYGCRAEDFFQEMPAPLLPSTDGRDIQRRRRGFPAPSDPRTTRRTIVRGDRKSVGAGNLACSPLFGSVH